MMRYKIVATNEAEHSIVVRFYTDTITEQMLAGRTDFNITLPVPTPEGAALEEFIVARAPVQWLQTLEAVKDQQADTSLASISELVGVEKSFEA